MQNRDKPKERIVAPIVPATQIEQIKPGDYDIAELVKNVAVNRAEVQFPSDPWGFTREVKKALLEAAALVRGNPVKLKLLTDTLVVGLAHAKKRFPEDQEKMQNIQNTQARYAEAREPLERWAAPKVQKGTN